MAPGMPMAKKPCAMRSAGGSSRRSNGPSLSCADGAGPGVTRPRSWSVSRPSGYEKRLIEAVEKQLAADPRARCLVDLAAEDPAGFDAPLNPRRRALLERAEIRAFVASFTNLDRADRAEALYALVERSSDAVDEIARNLFRLRVRRE